jgi:two-component system chemotaxis response regulator CheY
MRLEMTGDGMLTLNAPGAARRRLRQHACFREGSADVVGCLGFDALRLLPRGAWDLVITDINMPDINGLELISFIRKNEAHKTTPILIISTASSERDRERGMTLGASGYLVKPFTAEALVQHALEQMGAASASGAHG